MNYSYALLIPVAAAVVGCASPVPVAQNFSLTHQKVARTAHHWDVVAEDVVEQTMQAMADKPQLQSRGVYVSPTRNTAFNTAFREFMITHLVDRGANVSVCKTATQSGPGFSGEGKDVEVQYDTQLVVHANAGPEYQPPMLTVLASGIAVVRNTALAGHVTSATLGGIAAADWWAGYLASPSRAEIIVTTTIAENNRFVARKSDIYYVPDGDTKLFVQKIAARSMCPSERTAKTSAEDLEVDQEIARQEMIERGQARSNPQWRSAVSYSY